MIRWSLPVSLAIVAVACAKSMSETAEPERKFVQTVYNKPQTETFVRSAHHLSGTIVSASQTITYRANIGPDGLIPTIEVTANARGQTIKRTYPLSDKTMPMIPGSTALLEQILRRAKVVGGDTISIPTVLLGMHPIPNVMTVIGNGPDSLMIMDRTWDPKMAFHLAIDSAWHITGGVIPVDRLTIQPL
jgi:hypothetical protein